MRTKGFTLIELLVVIAIIGLLVAVGIGSYPTILRNSRDSVRKNDLQQLATALAVYSQDNNGLFVPGGGTCADTGNFYTEIADYMANQKVPLDPTTKTQYCYESINNGESFKLYAKLENCNDSIVTDKPTCESQKSTTDTYNVVYDSASENPIGVPIATDIPTDTPGAGESPTNTPTPVPNTLYVDNDHDGYGAGAALAACPATKTCVTNNQDCGDGDAQVKPGQTSFFAWVNGNGNYDWNCDGMATLAYDYQYMSRYAPQYTYGNNTCGAINTSTLNIARAPTSPPSCGAQVECMSTPFMYFGNTLRKFPTYYYTSSCSVLCSYDTPCLIYEQSAQCESSYFTMPCR